MHHNLKIKDDDFSIQSNQEHVARAFADADKARMEYLNKRIKETKDDEDGEVVKSKLRPHTKTAPGTPCLICGQKLGHCSGIRRTMVNGRLQNVQD